MMNAIVSWQYWIPLLQIQLAATMVMLAAACLARLIATHRVVARERLWHAALVGVFASTLVPLLGVIAPMAGPELAILPTAVATSDSDVVATEIESIAVPIVDPQAPLFLDRSVSKPPQRDRVAKNIALPTSLLSQAHPLPIHASPSEPIASPVDHSSLQRREVPERSGSADGRGPVSLQVWIVGAILLVWCIGMAYHLARGLVGLLICRRIVATARPVDSATYESVFSRLRQVLSLKTLPPICMSSKVGSPAVIGTLRPHIVLPDGSTNWMSSAQLFQVLLHETAHIVRRDPVVNLLQVLARALFWHHPLVYWLNRRLSQSREEVCDNFVLAHTDAADYAETLLDMTQKCPRFLAVRGLAILSDDGSLEARVTALLSDARDRSIRWPLWRKVALISVLVLVPILLGLVRVTERASHADESKKTATAEKAAKSTAETAKPSEIAETGTGRIVGRVLFDKDGGVASGAKAILLPPPPRGETVYIGLLPLREVAVDADGKFSFENLPVGKYQVWANLGKQTSRKKVREGETIVVVEGGEEPKPIDLRLTDGMSVTAHITDKATGKVIPDATVHLGWSDLIGDFQADGINPVIVQPLTPERWFVEAWADGYSKESQWLNLENGEDAGANFQLVPGGSLVGEVRDPQGKPVEEVGLSVSYEGNLQQVDYVETDKQGRYQLNHLALGRKINIYVSKLDWSTQSLPAQLADDVSTLNIKLARRPHGGTVIGVVQDADGRPVADAEVANMGWSFAEVRQTKSDKDGRFKLDNVYKGGQGVEITVKASSFAPQWFLNVEPGTPEKPEEITVKLVPGHRIAGRVTDERENALEGASVSFQCPGMPFQLRGQATTDKEGRFEFDSLPAFSNFNIRKEGYSAADQRQLPVDSDDVVAIQLAPVGVILGKVTDSTTGKPIRAFNVRISFSGKGQPGDPSSGLRSDWIKPGQAFQSKSGQFKLSELVAGVPLRVMVDAEGFQTSVQELVYVARSDKAEEVTFEMEAVDSATLRSYRGKLVDAEGAPVAGAQLRLIVARDRKPGWRTGYPYIWPIIRSGELSSQAQVLQFLEGTTDKEGMFEFNKIPRKAEVELAWWGDKIVTGIAQHLEALAEEEGMQITLAAPARILGKIDRKEYPNISRIEVSPIDRALEGQRLELKAKQKEFEFGNLAPGTYNVTLMGPNEPVQGGWMCYPLTTMKIDIEEGETKRIDFALGTSTPIPQGPLRTTPLVK